MNCILRKFILGKINDVLKARAEDVEKASAAVTLWTGRAKAVCQALESLSAKVADGKVTQEEAEQAAAELRALVESWR